MTDSAAAAARAASFLDLHRPGAPLLMPNAWDAGSARVLASLGFAALATTSSGFAATLGRMDGSVSAGRGPGPRRGHRRRHRRAGLGRLRERLRRRAGRRGATITRAAATGLAGCSIEDFTGRSDDPIYAPALAAERVAAAAEAAHAGTVRLVLTARAENYLHGRADLGDTIARLQSYQAAGADVLYAPGLR